MADGPTPKKLLLAAVSGGRQDATLMFAASMLRLQTDILTNQDLTVSCDVAFVECLDDALNAALKSGHDAVVAIDTRISFPSSFVTRFLKSPHAVVAAPHPVPGVMDWDRIAKRPLGTAERVQFAGNVYAPAPPMRALANEYWTAGSELVGSKKLMCVGVKREAIEAVAAVAPVLGDDRSALCFPRVEKNGRALSADEAFLASWGGELVLDLASPCAAMGPIAFQGSVADKESIR